MACGRWESGTGVHGGVKIGVRHDAFKHRVKNWNLRYSQFSTLIVVDIAVASTHLFLLQTVGNIASIFDERRSINNNVLRFIEEGRSSLTNASS